METCLTWDESKRRANLRKHGLDFMDAGVVLDSRYRLDVAEVRHGERRVQSFSYVMKRLAVLTVVHTEREETARVISFRFGSESESEKYYEWINQEGD